MRYANNPLQNLLRNKISYYFTGPRYLSSQARVSFMYSDRRRCLIPQEHCELVVAFQSFTGRHPGRGTPREVNYCLERRDCIGWQEKMANTRSFPYAASKDTHSWIHPSLLSVRDSVMGFIAFGSYANCSL